MLTTLPAAKVAEVVGSLARARSLELTATRTHVPLAEVRRIASEFGWPDLARLIEAADDLRNPGRVRPEQRHPRPAEPVDPETAVAAEPVDPETAVAAEPAAAAQPEPVSEPKPEAAPAVEESEEAPAVESPEADPAPAPATVPVAVPATAWAAGERSIEALLDEAAGIGVGRFPVLAADVWQQVRHLTDLVEGWHSSQHERTRLLDELEELQARQGQLLSRLTEIGQLFGAAAEPITEPITEPTATAGASAELWFGLTTAQRQACRAWATSRLIPCPRTGRIPATVIDAWLIANPDGEDPA